MTTLITGAGGFLGSTLMTQAAALGGSEIVGITRNDGDLRNEAFDRDVMDRVRPNRIVHLAATLNRDAGADMVSQQIEHTFQAGANVIKCGVASGVRHMVMAGSVDEIGNRGGLLEVTASTQPRSAYGLAKSLLREYAVYWTRRGSLRVDWFRPFVMYGPGQTRGSMLIPTAFRAARFGERAVFSDGVQQRDFIHVDDVVRWILLALRVPIIDHPGVFTVHHLGTGTAAEVRAVLSAIREEFPGSDFDVGALPRREDEPLQEVAAPYTCQERPLDQWRPTIGWREGIASTAAWWRRLGV